VERSRDPVLWTAAALLLAAAVVGAVEATSWVERPFPGFLVLGNRVVASAGLSRWEEMDGRIYQHEIVAVDDRPLLDARDLHAMVQSLPVGTPVRYRFRKGESEFELTVRTRRFDRVDFTLLFGAYLLNGVVVGLVALAIRLLRRRDQLANGTFPALWITAMWALTATDLYGPYRLFRIHALCETLLFAGTLHMALVFPEPYERVRRSPKLVRFTYALGAALALVAQVGLGDPGCYAATHLVATSAFGLSVGVLIASQVHRYLRPPTFEARQRVRIVALGALGALSPFVFLALISTVTGGKAPENMMAFTGFLFPASIAYAVLHHNLLDVDALVRRSLSYGVLTAAIAVLYAGLLVAFDTLFRGATPDQRVLFAAAFAIVCVVILLPMRDRVQSTINRLFFRAAYDYRRTLEGISGRLASVADLDVIAGDITRSVAEVLHPEWLALYARRRPGGELELVAGTPPPAPEVVFPLAREAMGPFDWGTRALGVPFKAEGVLLGVLLLGRPLSGRVYGGDDRRLLGTLANQGAIAMGNALALEQLRDLNRNLEQKVLARTRELSDALETLRRTQAQLVHREKMASLGQFIAGIAHELNNPLNFVLGNLHYLRQYAETLASAVREYESAARQAGGKVAARAESLWRAKDLERLLADLPSAFDGFQEGIDRATSLVSDLRTFSRLDEAERVPVNLHDALDSTLNLLRGRLAGIRVVKEYGALPPVECLGGQMNQVFMNLLSNAADAVGERGTITIRTARAGEERVAITIEDDGCGIEPGHIDRIFDPFFTTKEVGKGTGLGLSISYEIVSRHGGTLLVQSQRGAGASFRIELPITGR
jgi:signal transduction histidine kinase